MNPGNGNPQPSRYDRGWMTTRHLGVEEFVLTSTFYGTCFAVTGPFTANPRILQFDGADLRGFKIALTSQPSKTAILARYIHSMRMIMAARLPYVAL